MKVRRKGPVMQIQLPISRHTTKRKQRRVNRLRLAMLEVCRRQTQEDSVTNYYTDLKRCWRSEKTASSQYVVIK